MSDQSNPSASSWLGPLPPPPDPTVIAQWTGQIRTLIALTAGLGLGGTWLGHITNQEISADLTAIMTVAGLMAYAGSAIWSWLAKRRAMADARKIAVASAIASAQATSQTGVPTALTVAVAVKTPPDQPDIGVATRVTAGEAAASPAVAAWRAP